MRLGSKRFNWLAAGRRWRKTTLVMAIAVEAAARGKSIIWGAPTYDQVRIGWAETKQAARYAAGFNQSTMTATFASGGSILFRSLDNPDSARGHTADGVVIDESADVAPAAYYEVLRPMLIDTGGWLWAIGTPKGRNWFWREFVMAAERGDSASWNAPTLGCQIIPGGLLRHHHPLENPVISFDEMLHLRRTLPDRTFRQEILAEFIEEQGGVFRNVAASIDRGRTGNRLVMDPGLSYAMGVDLARVEDFTVVTSLSSSLRQIYFDRFNQISWERQISAIVDAARTLRPTTYVDSTGVGDPIFERVINSGVDAHPYHLTNASKNALIDNLAMLLEQGRVRLMDVPEQEAELQAYAYELTPGRNVRMGAPEGMHDDTVIALALAAWGASDAGCRIDHVGCY